MSNYVVWLLIVSFWFIAAMQSSGVVEYFAKKLLGLSFVKKGPYILMFLFLFAAWLISIFAQAAIAVTVILLALLKSVSEELKLKKHNTWTALTGLGIGLFSLLGVMVLPFNANTVTTTSVIGASFGVTNMPAYGPYVIYMLLFQIIGMVLFVLISKYLIRPKVNFDELKKLSVVGNGKKEKMSGPVKHAIVGIIAVVVIMFLPVVFPADSIVSSLCNRFGVAGAFAVAIVIMCFARNEEGHYVFNFGTAVRDAVHWDIVLYTALLLYFANFLNLEETGIPQIFSVISAPLANMSPFMVICILSLLMTILTNVMNNFVTALLFAPIGFGAIGLDNPYSAMLMLMVLVSTYLSIALPPSSSTAIILHADRDMFTSKQLIGYGYFFCMFLCIIALVLLYFMQGLFL